ncbi:uncharacterized protein [Lolium perenne]|uniref:uncharacterized protein n=1 Tax=Lolium perenne TaxID=4522 RepID=UPI003A98DF4B
MAEEKKVFTPLRLRSHEAHDEEKMEYDDRYTKYIERLGLLPFITLVTRSTPAMNPCAITALVDRWRPETHTFHLGCGEMTVTLQDVSMILALPISGAPLCFSTNSKGWRDSMRSLIGCAPLVKDMPAGAPYTWISLRYKRCPELATKEVVQYGGRNAPYMWLKALTSWDSKFSWGTAALAYLYRQLDEACRRSDPQACIGGPLLLLSVWMWSRLPVGLPDVLPHDDWDEYGMRQCRPTWAFFYDKVEPYVGKTKTMYKYYSNEFDSLTPGMVNWEPYGKAENFARIYEFDLNPQCTAEAHLWRMQCPLICLYAVEYHLPQRVMTQFGLFQETPPEWKDTSIDLHRLDRMQQKTITNWADHHSKYIIEWWEVLRKAEKTRDDTTRRFDSDAFDYYVAWLKENTRWEVNAPAFTQQETLELPNPGFDDIANLQYNRLIRDGRPVELAPVLRFVAEYAMEREVDGQDHDEISTSHLEDAPQPTRPTQPRDFGLKPRRPYERWTPEQKTRYQRLRPRLRRPAVIEEDEDEEHAARRRKNEQRSKANHERLSRNVRPKGPKKMRTALMQLFSPLCSHDFLLRVDSSSPPPPLSFFLSGGYAGRRGDGLGGRLLLYIVLLVSELGFPQWVVGHVPSRSVSLAPAGGVERLAVLLFLAMVARCYEWQGGAALVSSSIISHQSGWWSSGVCSSATSSSTRHGGDGEKRVAALGSQFSGGPGVVMLPFLAEDSRRPSSWRPTLLAIWWPPRLAMNAGKTSTSMWRPCSEFNTALHFLLAPSGLVPGAGEDGRVSSSAIMEYNILVLRFSTSDM